jgi:hypothetical protein
LDTIISYGPVLAICAAIGSPARPQQVTANVTTHITAGNEDLPADLPETPDDGEQAGTVPDNGFDYQIMMLWLDAGERAGPEERRHVSPPDRDGRARQYHAFWQL